MRHSVSDRTAKFLVVTMTTLSTAVIVMGLHIKLQAQELQEERAHRVALTTAALDVVYELTGLLGTDRYIDQLLDVVDTAGRPDQVFTSALLRCQHVGWWKGPDAALPHCERLLRIARSPEEVDRARIELARCQVRGGNLTRASDLLAAKPQNDREMLVRFYQAKAEVLNALGRYSEAIAAAREITEAEEADKAFALYQLAKSALALGDLRAADTYLKQGEAIRRKLCTDNPEYDEYWLNYARLLRLHAEIPGHAREGEEARTIITALRQREPARWELTAGY